MVLAEQTFYVTLPPYLLCYVTEAALPSSFIFLLPSQKPPRGFSPRKPLSLSWRSTVSELFSTGLSTEAACQGLSKIVFTWLHESVSAHPGWVFERPIKPAHTCCGLVRHSLVTEFGWRNSAMVWECSGLLLALQWGFLLLLLLLLPFNFFKNLDWFPALITTACLAKKLLLLPSAAPLTSRNSFFFCVLFVWQLLLNHLSRKLLSCM